MYGRTRLSLVEYGAPIDLSRKISEAIDIDAKKANNLLGDAGKRVASILGLKYNPISVDAKGVRAIDCAGLIRLSPSLELEIAPKFLGYDDSDASWREDFFFLATLSRYGRLLTSEQLSSSGGKSRDLSTLVALSITSMYKTLKLRPLRSYRKVKKTDFFIDGDLDPLDIIFPSSDGFEQEIVCLDQRNGWNAAILAAAKELLPEISDPSIVSSLVRLIEELSPQNNFISNSRKPIPARHKAWKPLYELSMDVLDGLGISYKQGRAHAPGYLVSTWQMWENLLTLALRQGFGHSVVRSQKSFQLGTKYKVDTGAISKVSVVPDCLIESDGVRPRMLLDAKYKGHIEKGRLRMSEADIYEALAFTMSTNCNLVVLAYPALATGTPNKIGACEMFEKVNIGDVQIVGIQVESRHISKRGAFKQFALNFAEGLSIGF